MNATKHFKKFLSLALVLVMLVGFLPVSALQVNAQAADPTIVIAASDYQNSSSQESDRYSQTNALLSRIVKDYPTAEGFLFGGDYSTDSQKQSTTESGMKELDGIVDDYYPGISDDNRIYIQGNHDYNSSLLSASGAHDTDAYGVYAINYKDFPEDASSSKVQSLASAMKAYFDAKVADGYNKPIFVLSHLPLHAGRGDNENAGYLAEVLNEAGEAGLNIIFLAGHNHSGNYDDYLGNGAYYLPVGSSLPVATDGGYNTVTINFTYMNYGYVGFVRYYSNTDKTLTATVFEINENTVVVKRYDADGLHVLKAEGVKKDNRPIDDRVIESPDVIMLGAPVPSVEVMNADGTVTVKAPGLTGLSAEKVTTGYDTTVYSTYVTYDIQPEGYIQGTAATVTVRLNGFDAMKPVRILKDGEELVKTSLVDGTVSFTTKQFGTFSFAQTVANGYTYELATEIVDGEQYVIVTEKDAYGAGDGAYALVSADPNEDFEGGVQEVEVDSTGTLMTAEEEPVLWTFEENSNGTYKIWNEEDGRVLGHKDSYWYENGNGDTEFDITEKGDGVHFRLFAGDSRLTFRHEGDTSRNPWSRNNDNDDEPEYVRLYRVVGGVAKPNEDGFVTITKPVSGPTTYYYEQAASVESGKAYVIVDNDYAVALMSDLSGKDVTIDGSTISSSTELTQWTFGGTGSVTISNNGMYLSVERDKVKVENKSDKKVLVTDDGDCFELSKKSSEGWLYYSGSKWTANKSSKEYVRLYQLTGSETAAGTPGVYAKAEGELTQAYTTADGATLDTVLGKLMLQTSADGKNAETSAPVTADMITWDVAFDGNKAGTYTGTLFYQGKALCYVVVTVTGETITHQFETVTVEATCTTDGSVTTTCTICGQQTVEVIPATGHSYTETVTAPTCATDGATVYTCTCGDTYTEVIPATGHSYGAVVTAPTCTEAGYTTYTCACGDSYTADEVAALGHSYTAATTEPGCSQDGATVYTCACGDTYTEVIPATGKHTYKETTVAATCTQDGATVYTCDCGDTYTVVIPALGHSYTAKVVAPTCEKAGYTAYTCACGDSYTADEVAALGHDYTAKVVAPTCEKAGYTAYNCACGDSYTADEVAALGHDYTAETTAPTCEKAGYTAYTCACGDSYTADEVAALGHDYTAEVTAPTCTQDGKTVYTCGNCGHAYSEKLAALGHDYSCVEADGCKVYTCGNCGDSYTERLNLTYTKVSTVEADNRYVITFEAGKEYYAMSHKDNTISIAKVTISNNEITSEVTEDLIWTYADNKLSYEDDDQVYYLYAAQTATTAARAGDQKAGTNKKPGGPGAAEAALTVSTTEFSTVTIDDQKIMVGSYYLHGNKDKIKLENKGSKSIFFVEG